MGKWWYKYYMNRNTLGNLIGAAILVAYVGVSYLLYDPSKKEISS